MQDHKDHRTTGPWKNLKSPPTEHLKVRMPNYCDNWIRISGDEEVLRRFEARPFALEMVDSPPVDPPNSGENGVERRKRKDRWIETHWGTPWIAPMGNHSKSIRFQRKDDGSLYADFLSLWTPPVPFYNRLAERYPAVKIEYEYIEWGVRYCGYGVGSPGGESHHYYFSSKEDLRELNELRVWNVSIWNPHFTGE
jgi:hypothetical protein